MTSAADVPAHPPARDNAADAFKHADARSYDDVATTFDRLTDEFSAPLAEHLVDCARLVPGERVLDVGTGTGVVALRAAERVSPDGRTCAIDLSPGMLAVLHAKSRARHATVMLCRMDAEALAFTGGSFDAIVSLFALMHFPDPLKALRRMYAALRPGGRIVVGVGSGPPPRSLSGWLHRIGRLPEIVAAAQGRHLIAPAFLNRLVDHYLPATHSNPEESPLARSHQHPADTVPALLCAASFTEVETSWRGHTVDVDSAEAFWALQATFSSIARKRLSGASPAALEALRSEFFRRCEAVQQRGGRLLFPQAALFVTARRPG